jgi:hypothetical protein
MSDNSASCKRTAASVDSVEAVEATESTSTTQEKKETLMTAKVGQKAPDFSTMAYHKGAFKPITLSDYFGKWILLCFYPGDFTFV